MLGRRPLPLFSLFGAVSVAAETFSLSEFFSLSIATLLGVSPFLSILCFRADCLERPKAAFLAVSIAFLAEFNKAAVAND